MNHYYKPLNQCDNETLQHDRVYRVEQCDIEMEPIIRLRIALAVVSLLAGLATKGFNHFFGYNTVTFFAAGLCVVALISLARSIQHRPEIVIIHDNAIKEINLLLRERGIR